MLYLRSLVDVGLKNRLAIQTIFAKEDYQFKSLVQRGKHNEKNNRHIGI
jgi:hypothetical protein